MLQKWLVLMKPPRLKWTEEEIQSIVNLAWFFRDPDGKAALIWPLYYKME